MSFLAPLFFVGLAAIAAPIFIHLIQRERRDVIEFPSLMFLRRIPYQSVERRRIHNWLLLLLRVAAMALIVAAFSRPFLTQDPVKAAAATTGAREVVVLLDRSASMGYGDHFARAQAEARKVIDGLSGDDRATLVLFGRGVEEAVRATPDRARLDAAVNSAAVTSDGTRYAPALRLVQSLLSRSDRPRKEAYFISDFQKTGWERQEDIRLPEGATITPISVAEPATSDLSVSSISIQRAAFSGEERATITAGLVNRSASPVKQSVRLEIDGRVVGTRDVSLDSNASGSATFDAVTVSEANMRGVIHAGSDALPKDNDFYFVLSPSRPISVLIIQGDNANPNTSFYVSAALETGKAPPFKWDVAAASRLTPGQFERRSVVVLNDATALSGTAIDSLSRFVNQGGGLLVALGQNTPLPAGSPLVPSAGAAPVDRLAARGGTLGFLDYSHPIFEQFKDPRNGNFSNMRFLRYRGVAAAPGDRVLARFDDGATALVERRVGSGRVITFASTLDADWNDAPKHPMFLPFFLETVRYLAQYEEPSAWYPVGRMFDISAAVSAVVREGQANETVGAGRGGTGIAVSPSGTQVTLGTGGVPSIELSEQGFYSVRLPGIGDRRPYSVAVDLDPAESDLTPLSPVDFLKAATGGGAVTPAGQSLERPDLTPADVEKKQSVWWFLLVGGVLALVAEALLSNRRSGFIRHRAPAA